MELWDVYNKDREKTGKTMIRGNKIEKDCYHLVVHACIFNKKGEMLIQQRQSFKKGWANLWDITAGGSATKGETSQTAIERELYEELGVRVNMQDVRPHYTVNFNEGFDDVYLIEKEIDLADLTLQYEEVQSAKWASLEEILSMIERGEFVPYYKEIIQLMFKMRSRYGAQEVKR